VETASLEYVWIEDFEGEALVFSFKLRKLQNVF
jgi:hypothetical protein